MTLELLKSRNNQLDVLLKSKDFGNPKVKQIIRNQKVVIYSIPNLHVEPIDLLVQAKGTFAQLNLFYTLASRNEKDFEKAVENARFFYENQLHLPLSENHYQIKAIHLLLLLSSHRNEEFYSKLQNLTPQELGNSFIQYAFRINDAIQEGNYRRVFKLKKESPLVYFSPFLDKIQDTVRIEIAKSAEKAYTVLTLKDALQVFQVQNEGQLRKFVDKYQEIQEERQIEWSIQDGRIFFKRLNKNKIKFNSDDLIKTTLYYANELEKIA